VRKRCSLGKSCGATCIERRDACLLELPQSTHEPLSKTATLIQNFNNKSYNFAELVSAVVIADPTVKTKADVVNAVRNNKKIIIDYPERYIENLKMRSSKLVEDYISSAKEKFAPLTKDGVSKVYVLGANAQKNSIAELNKGLAKKENKADIIFYNTKGQPIGISVKSSQGDRTTNFSIEKMTGQAGVELRKFRNNYLKELREIGLNEDQIRNDFAKKQMSPYMSHLNNFILTNKPKIIDEWIKGVGVENVKYPIYQFDGKNLKDQQELGRYLRSNQDKIDIKLQPRTGRGTSLYYEVFVNGKKEYQWEVRKVMEGSTTLETRVRNKEVVDKNVNKEMNTILKNVTKGLKEKSPDVPKKVIIPKSTPKPRVKPPDLEKQLAGLKQLVVGYRNQGFKEVRIMDELKKLGVRPALVQEVLKVR